MIKYEKLPKIRGLKKRGLSPVIKEAEERRSKYAVFGNDIQWEAEGYILVEVTNMRIHADMCDLLILDYRLTHRRPTDQELTGKLFKDMSVRHAMFNENAQRFAEINHLFGDGYRFVIERYIKEPGKFAVSTAKLLDDMLEQQIEALGDKWCHQAPS